MSLDATVAQDESTLDSEAFDRLLRLGGARLLRQMIALFLTHGARHVETLSHTDEQLALDEQERAAHSLKTSAAHVGAVQVHRLAEEMERAAAARDRDGLRTGRTALRTAFDRACRQLSRIHDELSAAS